MKNSYFPLLGFKGICHYWKYVLFLPGGLSKWKIGGFPVAGKKTRREQPRGLQNRLRILKRQFGALVEPTCAICGCRLSHGAGGKIGYWIARFRKSRDDPHWQHSSIFNNLESLCELLVEFWWPQTRACASLLHSGSEQRLVRRSSLPQQEPCVQFPKPPTQITHQGSAASVKSAICSTFVWTGGPCK